MTKHDGQRELIAALHRGDQGALGTIFDREAADAMALAVRIAGDRIPAEEIVHDAFLALWVRAATLHHGTDIRAWIRNRVRRIGLDRASLPATPTVSAADDAPAPASDGGRATPGARPPSQEAARRLLLIEPDAEVATAFREILVDLGFEVAVHPVVRAWWPDVMAWDVVVLNTAGARLGQMMGSLQVLRNAPETADALIVCGGLTEDEPLDRAWLASNRVNVLSGALDIARVTEALRTQ